MLGNLRFLKHLRYVSAFTEFQRAIYTYIDLGSQAALESDLKAFIILEIEKQLLENYDINIQEEKFVRGVYHADIVRFRASVQGALHDTNIDMYNMRLIEFLEEKENNKAEHLKLTIQHIARGRSKQVVLMIDNADQRGPDVQQDAFIIAPKFLATMECYSFYHSSSTNIPLLKKSRGLFCISAKIFSIAPPRSDLVIEKRLTFALKMAEGKLPRRETFWA